LLVGATAGVLEHEMPLSFGLNGLGRWHESFLRARGDTRVLIVRDGRLRAASGRLSRWKHVRVFDPMHVGGCCRTLKAPGGHTRSDLVIALFAIALHTAW